MPCLPRLNAQPLPSALCPTKVDGMQALEAAFGDDALHYIRALLDLSPMPAQEDLAGAAKGILRLQRTYDL